MSRRIWQYPEVTALEDDDYILIDSAENDSRSLLASKVGAVHINKTVTERGTYNASDDEVNGYAQVVVDVPYTDVHVAAGDIASFEGEYLPLKALTASIEPIQDLHGYDNLWVGGSQKNKIPNIPSSYTNGDVLVDYGSEKTFNGYALSFKFSGSFVNSGASFLVGKDSNDTNVVIITPQNMKKVSDGTIIVANTTYTNESVYFVSSATVNVRKFVLYTYPSFTNPVFKDCQFENGNTPTTYQPYSNICPISGWDECNVSDVGVNLWDEETEVVSNVICSKNYIPVRPNTQYYFTPHQGRDYICYDKYYNVIKDWTWFTPNDTILTTPSNCYYIKFRMTSGYGTTYNHDISINYPSTDTSYHEYNGTTYTIEFLDGSTPLTVYGGKLNVTTGVLTVDKVYYQFTDSKTYTITGSARLTDRWITSIINITGMSGEIKNRSGVMSSISPQDAEYTTITVSGFCKNLSSPYPIINITDSDSGLNASSSATDIANAVNTFLHQHTPQIVYELATPQVVQLSPTEVKSLLGVNNIFADTGAVDVEYQTVWVRPTN